MKHHAMAKEELAQMIEKFLGVYGCRAADDPESWSSPDAAELDCCAQLLRDGMPLPRFPWSEWGSGGYRPYSSKEGRAAHDEILDLVKDHVGE